MADPFLPKFVDLVRNTTTTTGTGNIVLGAAVNGFTSFASAVQPGESFYYSVIGTDKPAEREVGRGTMQSNGTISRDPISGTKTNFTSGNKTIALIAAAEWFGQIQSGLGAASASATAAAASAAAASTSATAAETARTGAETAEAGAIAARDAALAAGSGGSSSAATRTALAAVSPTAISVNLGESGREGLFVFDSANLSAKVSADPRQGLYVARSSDPSGASGAWIRKFSGPVSVTWFGAKGDGTTDDGSAFTAALALLKATAVNDDGGVYKASAGLFIPAGHYFLGTTTLDITHTLTIQGDGTGLAGGNATKLGWAANTTGIRIQRYNTSGAATVDGPHYAGDGTIIRKLCLKGAYANAEGEYHAIHTKAHAVFEDLIIQDFQGDGIYAAASAGAGNATEGNANNAVINRVRITGCRDGLYLDGADANAWMIQKLDVSGNRRWGVNDSSFLGNAYYSCHAADNGFSDGNTAASLVHYNGNRYYVIDGQAAGASTNSPSGTTASNVWWGYAYGGGPAAPQIPTWTSGMAVRAGGAFHTDNANAANLFVGCYTEGGQPPSQLVSPTFSIGGVDGALTKGTAGRLSVQLGSVNVESDFSVGRRFDAASADNAIGPWSGAPANNLLELRNTSSGNTIRFNSYAGGVLSQDGYVVSARGWGMYINGSNLVRFRVADNDIGTFEADGLHVIGGVAASGAVTGSNLSGSNTGDQTITLTGDVTGSGTGSFAATIGANAVTFGKLVAATGAGVIGAGAAGNFQQLGLAGGLAVSGGTLTIGAITPTSVAATGAITSSGTSGVGYATGAGGTVTQATSKSTAVTLNKPSGQIVMNAASLAAAAVVEFSVNNSAVTASDIINLSLKSGAATTTAYRYWVSAVAAGSFKICVENRSAGALSEALVFGFALIKGATA